MKLKKMNLNTKILIESFKNALNNQYFQNIFYLKQN